MNPIILGLASGYKWISVAIFLRSVRRSGFLGDVVLFVDAHNRSLINHVERHGAIAVPIGPTYPYFATSGRGSGHSDGGFFDTAAPHIRRYKLYQLYLGAFGRPYDRVMLCDVKDVLFQSDPFRYDDGGSALCVFEEDGARPIADCVLNARWVKDAFGEGSLARFADRPILCSGTTLGTLDGVRKYCDVMVDTMYARNVAWVGGDQGVHNYIVRTCQMDDVKVFPNEQGPVLTLAFRTARPEFDAAANVVNRSGRVPNVLHQYDRHPALLSWANARYLTASQRCWVGLSNLKRAQSQ